MSDALTRRVVADARLMMELIDSVGGNDASLALKRFYGSLEGALGDLILAAFENPLKRHVETRRPCEGYVWVGQSMSHCERCSRPAWEHSGMEIVSKGPFSDETEIVPWSSKVIQQAHRAWKAGKQVDCRIDEETGQMYLRYPDS